MFTLQVSSMKNPLDPEILFISNTELCDRHSAKILGVIFQSDLKWNLYIDELIKRCNRQMYMLRKLKKFNYL